MKSTFSRMIVFVLCLVLSLSVAVFALAESAAPVIKFHLFCAAAEISGCVGQ